MISAVKTLAGKAVKRAVRRDISKKGFPIVILLELAVVEELMLVGVVPAPAVVAPTILL